MADLPTNLDEVKEVIKEVVKPEGFPGEFTLGDGTVVKGNSWEEVFQNLDKRRVDTVHALRDRERQIEELRATPAPSQQTPAQQQTASALRRMTPEQQKQYWEYANQDPMLADDYKDSIKYGIPIEQVASLEREVFNTTQYSADKKEIEDFMQSNKDFPATKEATDKIWSIMAQENFPITSRNLEYVYLRAVRDGEIEPLQEEAPQPWVPPSMQGGGTERQRQTPFDPFEGVPDDKLDEVARRIGMMK